MPRLAEDRDAIRDLLARYAYNGDRGRLEGLAACFADDGVLEFTGKRAEGPGGIIAALSGGEHNPTLTFVRHHITNPLIEVAGDRAVARSYFNVYTNAGLDHVGTYNDQIVRLSCGWRFASRVVRIDWQSPESLYKPMATR